MLRMLMRLLVASFSNFYSFFQNGGEEHVSFTGDLSNTLHLMVCISSDQNYVNEALHSPERDVTLLLMLPVLNIFWRSNGFIKAT